MQRADRPNRRWARSFSAFRLLALSYCDAQSFQQTQLIPRDSGNPDDVTADRVEALVLSVQHIEQAALAELELQAIRFGHVGAGTRVARKLRQPDAIGSQCFPCLA